VLDLERRPVAELAIVLRAVPSAGETEGQEAAERATGVVTGGDGRFEMHSPGEPFDLGVRSEAWVDVYAAKLWNERTHPEVTIFVAPRRPLAGVIVDRDRHGIADASVEIVIDPGLRRDLGAVLDTNIAVSWRTKTDANGHFELIRAPIARSAINVNAVGWKHREVEPPAVPAYDLEIALEPLDTPHALVHGRVLDSDHRPVEGAYVALGPETVQSRANGAFEFDLDTIVGLDEKLSDGHGAFAPQFDPRSITAAKPGYLPARATLPPAEELRRAAAPIDIDLILGSKPLEIRGRIVDADGRAVPGAVILLQGETMFGCISQKTDTAMMRWFTTTERLLRGGVNRTDVMSDADGTFRLSGLLEKSYGIVAIDKRTLRRGTVGGVAAGSIGIVVTLPLEKECARVAGSVVSPSGTPIGGVRVIAGRDTHADAIDYVTTLGSSVVTDEHGRFEFAALDVTGLTLQVSSQSIFVLMDWKPRAGDSLDDITITASRRCHVVIDIAPRKSSVTRAVIVDAEGRPVKLLQVRGDVSWFPTEIPIVDGRSEAIACEETARTVVLYDGEKEVERVPFTPRPGEIVVVTP
jgi:hypothetical protein